MRFEHTIDIDAAPARVWEIMSDIQRWPEWTGTVRSFEWVEGDRLAVGAKARLEIDRTPTAVWTVTSVEEGKSFTWEADTRGVHSIGGHEVEPREGGSRVTLSIESSGFMATLFRPMISKNARQNMELEGAGLKRAAEALATTATG